MKKLIILLTTLLILQGCSSKDNISKEQLQSLTNSVTLNQLEKTEFDKKDNKLIITTNDEVINKEGFEPILKSLKLNGFNGKSLNIDNINLNEFNNKNFNIVIVTKNNNTVSFNIKDIVNRNYNITQMKYSNEYMKNKLTSFSKDLSTFNELAGTIETDLEKGRSLGDKVERFKETTTKVNSSIENLKSLSSENIEYMRLDEVKSILTRLEVLTKNVIVAVDTSVESKKGSSISSTYVTIVEIDKILRDLAAM